MGPVMGDPGRAGLWRNLNPSGPGRSLLWIWRVRDLTDVPMGEAVQPMPRFLARGWHRVAAFATGGRWRLSGRMCAGLLAIMPLAADTGDGGLAGAYGQLAPGLATGKRTVRLNLEEIRANRHLVDALPSQLIAMPREAAREFNAKVPYSQAANPAARPFVLGGDETSRSRAVDCLAAAQYYEAGSDWEGQRAVAQVVLNRARHPAYPKSVCGVVFQGAERRTGCQFTFTCDGAMARAPVPALWRQTLAIARDALAGQVYAKVGLSTHYHTDWVMPVWSGSLDKVTKVHTHLFFRWPGGWGRPPAFRTGASQGEPVIAMLAPYAASHRDSPAAAEAAKLALDAADPELAAGLAANRAEPALPALPGVNLRGGQLRLAHPEGDAFGFLLPRALPGSFGLLAYDVCAGREFCKVMGWVDRADIPRGFPIGQDAQRSMAFLYIYDRRNRREIMAWDCEAFPRPDPAECLDDGMTRWDAVHQP